MLFTDLDLKIQSSIIEYVHESWMPFFAPPLLYLTLGRDQRGRKKLSRMVLKKSWLDSSDRYQFVHSKEKLFSLVKFCGLAINHELFLKIISKDEKHLIQLVFGVEVWDFLFRYISFLNLPSFPLLNLKKSEGNLQQQVFRAGLRLIYWCVDKESIREYIRLATPFSMRHEANKKRPPDMSNYLYLFEKTRKYLNC